MINLIRRFTPRALRNWVRRPERSARYVFDRVVYALGGLREVQVRPDWTVRCHPGSAKHFAIFASDKAQSAELDAFVRYCRPDMQLLDAGAHHGLFALAAIRFGGSNVRVVCVEASRKAAEILVANVAANSVERQVRVLNVAIGAADGTVQMLSTGPAGSDYFVSTSANRADTIAIQQRSMATVLQQTGLCPTHVKIDVEGFEDDVVSGSANLLKQNRPILFLELHCDWLRARRRDPMSVISDLHKCGYERLEENGRQLSDNEITLRSECRLVCLPQ